MSSLKVLLLTCFLTCISAGPLRKIEISIEILDKICARLQSDEIKQYFPQFMVDPFCAADQETKQQFVDLVNEFHAGNMQEPIPRTPQEFVELLKERVPKGAEIFQNVYKEANDKVKAMTDNVHQFVIKYEKFGYENADPDHQKMFMNAIPKAKEFIKDANNFTQEDWDSIQREFPEIYALWHSDRVQTMIKFIENLPEDIDFEALRQMIQKTMGKYVPEATEMI